MLGLKKLQGKIKKEKEDNLKIFNEVMLENFDEIKSVLPRVYISKVGDVKEILYSVAIGKTTRTSSFAILEFGKTIPPSTRNQFWRKSVTYKTLLGEELKKEVVKLLRQTR